MYHDGPPSFRYVRSSPIRQTFRCPIPQLASEFSCVEILRGVYRFLLLVARRASEWIRGNTFLARRGNNQHSCSPSLTLRGCDFLGTGIRSQ